MNILDFPEAQKALEAARKAEAATAAELKSRTDAAGAKLATARQERETAIAAQQAATVAELRERTAAAKEERLLRQWLASGGKAEEWPHVRERVLVAATVATQDATRQPFTL